MNKKTAIGFDCEEAMLKGVKDLKQSGAELITCFTPYPVGGIEGIRLKKSRIPYIAFFGGIAGLLAAFYFQFWSQELDYPLNQGGKPFFSFLPSIPIAFVITILSSSLFIFFGFLMRKRTLQAYSESEIYESLSPDFMDRFILIIESGDRLSGGRMNEIIDAFPGAVIQEFKEDNLHR